MDSMDQEQERGITIMSKVARAHKTLPSTPDSI